MAKEFMQKPQLISIIYTPLLEAVVEFERKKAYVKNESHPERPISVNTQEHIDWVIENFRPNEFLDT